MDAFFKLFICSWRLSLVTRLRVTEGRFWLWWLGYMLLKADSDGVTRLHVAEADSDGVTRLHVAEGRFWLWWLGYVLLKADSDCGD